MVRNVILALLTVTLSFMIVASVHAADKKKKPEVQQDSRLNQPAPAFDLPGTDGKNHKLSDYKGKTLVITFQSNTCPWDRAYAPIMNKLAMDNSDVLFLGINSNRDETMEQIKETQTKDNIPYVILKDKGNKIADEFGALTTPHIFIINTSGKFIYIGGIEKAPSGVKGVGKSSEQYLSENLAAIKEGKPLPFSQSVPKGCAIKKE